MACLGSLVASPARASLSLVPPALSSIPWRHPVYVKLGLLKSWPKNFKPRLPIYAPKFDLISCMQGRFVQNLKRSGRKTYAGGFFGFSAATAMLFNQPNVAYAMDAAGHDREVGGPSGFLKDDLHTFFSLVKKFELPVLLLVTVLLGWRHPIRLAINIALLLLCTKPTPPSIYMFIEQLRQRDMLQDPSPLKSKFLYVKNVEVSDYKVLCFAKVELRGAKLGIIGILGGWWVLQMSQI